MKFCNGECGGSCGPENAAVRHTGRRQWLLPSCILFLVGSFCVGAMLLRWCDGQAELQFVAESVPVWTESLEERLLLPADHPWEIGKPQRMSPCAAYRSVFVNKNFRSKLPSPDLISEGGSSLKSTIRSLHSR